MKINGLTAAVALALSAGLAASVAHAQLVITTNTTIAPGDPTYQNQDVVVRGCTVTINGAQAFSSLTIERNEANIPGIVTHDATFSSGDVNGMFITIAGDLFIQGAAKGDLVASRIDVFGKGFPSAQGPGGGAVVIDEDIGFPAPAGGSYGGAGGVGSAQFSLMSHDAVLPAACYGSYTQPAEFGSGGGAVETGFPTIYTGTGGGAVRLAVSGSAVVNGSIIATGGGGGTDWAGGSGGSIWITANSLSGSGAILAHGGDSGTFRGGAGGGGRISIDTNSLTFSGPILACGGNSTAASEHGGGPGSLFTRVTGERDQLAFDNSTSAQLVAASAEFQGTVALDTDVIVRNKARVNARRGQSLDLTINGTLTIDATSQLGAFGRSPRSIPVGNGGLGSSSSLVGSGGGGHGGVGGHGRNGPSGPGGVFGSGGAVHGNPNAPVDFGGPSGSHDFNGPGWRGGGALHLTVTEGIALDGAISADGVPQATLDQTDEGGSGGGAGGSVWIEAPSISGSGIISARGGVGTNAGGGGGGGRIRVDSCSLSIPPANISVAGGPGATFPPPAGNGAPGTIVLAGASTDWNNDGVVNSTDVSDFINDWFTDQAKGSLLTDFNNDGVSNSTDVSDFINAWFEQEPLC